MDEGTKADLTTADNGLRGRRQATLARMAENFIQREKLFDELRGLDAGLGVVSGLTARDKQRQAQAAQEQEAKPKKRARAKKGK